MEPLYSFEISRPLLQAMALFQSGDEDRLILCSTKFELSANGRHELTLVSTDGRRLAVHRHEILTDNLLTDLPTSAEFSIDLSGVAKLPKVRGNKGRMVVCSVFAKHAEITCEKYKYKADFVTETQGGPNNLSVFPNWKQIIPAGEPSPVSSISVNFDLMESFGEAARLLSKESSGIIVRSYGENGALAIQFTQNREFYGILMPLHRQEDEVTQQDWVRDAQASLVKETAA